MEYCGTHYTGWQRQQVDVVTIQALLETAVATVANHPVEVTAAGRTDKGVHATQQIIHFDSNSDRTLDNWLLGINTHLPPDIRIVWVKYTDNSFHARFKATFRRYCYLIAPGPIKSGLFHDKVTWDIRHLNAKRMHQAAQFLVGTHDFSAFRAADCQAKHAHRTVEFIQVTHSESLIQIDIQANGFLHHMVRNIAGVLMTIGAEQQPIAWCRTVLETRDRRKADITAPACGLYFIQAGYPPEYAFDIAPRWPLHALFSS